METTNYQSLEFIRSRVDIMKRYTQQLSGLGIQHFHYIRVFDDGQYIHLVDDEVYAEFYLNTIHDVSSNFISLYQEGYREYLWPQEDSDGLLSAIQNYNVANGFSITRFSEHYYEAWSFSTVPEYKNIANVYIRYRDELRKFVTYFNNTASSLFIEANGALAKYKDYSFNHQGLWQKNLFDFSLDVPFVIGGQEVKLTNREKECLKEVSKGLTDKEIAKKLGISPRTVESHMSALKAKLDINTRSQAANIYHSQLWKE